MKSPKTLLNRARQRLINFQARSSQCPICGKNFRHGCNHSVDQAIQRLEENIIIATTRYNSFN